MANPSAGGPSSNFCTPSLACWESTFLLRLKSQSKTKNWECALEMVPQGRQTRHDIFWKPKATCLLCRRGDRSFLAFLNQRFSVFLGFGDLSSTEDQLEQRKKEPEDQHFFSLLQRRIDKNVLAKVLSLPPLPEAFEGIVLLAFCSRIRSLFILDHALFQDHSEVQMLMTHLSGADLVSVSVLSWVFIFPRHHTLSLFSRNGRLLNTSCVLASCRSEDVALASTCRTSDSKSQATGRTLMQ